MQVKYDNQKHESWVVHHCIQQNLTAARYTVYFWSLDFTLLCFYFCATLLDRIYAMSNKISIVITEAATSALTH